MGTRMKRTAALLTRARSAAPGAGVGVTPAEAASAVLWRILSCVLGLLSRVRRACYGCTTEHRGETAVRLEGDPYANRKTHPWRVPKTRCASHHPWRWDYDPLWWLTHAP